MCKLQSSLTDPASERIVLAGILQHGKDAFIDVSDIISTSSFTYDGNQVLYTVFSTALKAVDRLDIPCIVSTATSLGVYDMIAKNKKDLEYLKSLTSLPVHLENVRQYAKKIAKLEFARKAQLKMKEAYDNLANISGSESIDAILAIPENAIFSLVSELNSNSENKPENIALDGDELIQHVLDNPSETIGIPTPFKEFNAAIGGGLRRKGVTLVGGYAKAGKSSIGKETAIHISEKLDIPTLILDTEMSRENVFWRTVAAMSNVTINDLETGKFGRFHEKVGRVKEASAKLKTLKMEHISVAGKPFDEILSIIRRWILKNVGYDDNGKTKDCLVIYDYFKLMDSNVLQSMQEYQAMGFQIAQLADFTSEYDFACLAFVQLNREMDVAQSDRLKWLCSSYSSFVAKTAEEIANDGVEGGNRKLKVELTRFGPGLAPDDYINMNLKGDICKLYELGTKKSGNKKTRDNDSGFGYEEGSVV